MQTQERGESACQAPSILVAFLVAPQWWPQSRKHSYKGKMKAKRFCDWATVLQKEICPPALHWLWLFLQWLAAELLLLHCSSWLAQALTLSNLQPCSLSHHLIFLLFLNKVMKLLGCPTEVWNARKHNWGLRNQISPSLLQFPSSTLAGQLDMCHQIGCCSKHVPATTWQMQLERRAISLGRGGVLETPVCCLSPIKSGWEWVLHSHRGLWGIYDDISFICFPWKQILVDMIFLRQVSQGTRAIGGWEPLVLHTMGVSLLLTLWCS